MRNPGEVARRWLDQALHNLRVAESHLKNRFYSDACFMAEQAAQAALKAYLYSRGHRSIPIQSVAHLAEQAAAHSREFRKTIEGGKILDKYYIPTRYPDALAPPLVPHRAYTAREAREALAIARRILRTGEGEMARSAGPARGGK